jgi:hypothetical protein
MRAGLDTEMGELHGDGVTDDEGDCPLGALAAPCERAPASAGLSSLSSPGGRSSSPRRTASGVRPPRTRSRRPRPCVAVPPRR